MTNIDLDKLDAVAAGGHSYLLQCIEGFADGYFGGSDGKIDASHAEHFAEDLVESIEWEDETLCLVEAGVLSAVVAELRQARTEAAKWLSGNDAWATKAKNLQGQVDRLTEKLQGYCTHPVSTDHGDGKEWCDTCNLQTAGDED